MGGGSGFGAYGRGRTYLELRAIDGSDQLRAPLISPFSRVATEKSVPECAVKRVAAYDRVRVRGLGSSEVTEPNVTRRMWDGQRERERDETRAWTA